MSAAPFRDRVVHHALVASPTARTSSSLFWEPRFIATSFACRVGKGTQQALDQCHDWVRRHKYAFHGDVVKPNEFAADTPNAMETRQPVIVIEPVETGLS